MSLPLEHSWSIIWNSSQEVVSFVQKPYFYQTAWFFLALATLLTLSLLLAYYIRVRTLRRRQDILEMLLSERTKDLEIERLYRDAKITQLYEVVSGIQRIIVASSLVA